MPGQTPGYTFAPTFENAQNARQTQRTQAPQGTIQTLNFKLPETLGPNAVSPQVAQPFTGGSNNAVLQAALKRIFGSMAQGGQPAAAAPMQPGMPAQAGAPAQSAMPAARPPGGGQYDVPPGLQQHQGGYEQPWMRPEYGANPFESPEFQDYLRRAAGTAAIPASVIVDNMGLGPMNA